MPKAIELTKGYQTVVDDEDFDWLSAWQWRASKSKGKVYAKRTVRVDGKITTINMHREIARKHGFLEQVRQIDHKNTDTLDNQKDNLRPATNQQNSYNRKPKSSTGYKGIWQRTDTGKWRARIKVDGRFIVLGQAFSTAEDAARAYNDAAIRYFGAFAKLNQITCEDEGG